MGNHEYCTECGESDYHYGQPCVPEFKAKHQKEIRDREAVNDKSKAQLERIVKHIKQRFKGLEIEYDNYGHAKISWYQFRKENEL